MFLWFSSINFNQVFNSIPTDRTKLISYQSKIIFPTLIAYTFMPTWIEYWILYLVQAYDTFVFRYIIRNHQYMHLLLCFSLSILCIYISPYLLASPLNCTIRVRLDILLEIEIYLWNLLRSLLLSLTLILWRICI